MSTANFLIFKHPKHFPGSLGFYFWFRVGKFLLWHNCKKSRSFKRSVLHCYAVFWETIFFFFFNVHTISILSAHYTKIHDRWSCIHSPFSGGNDDRWRGHKPFTGRVDERWSCQLPPMELKIRFLNTRK